MVTPLNAWQDRAHAGPPDTAQGPHDGRIEAMVSKIGALRYKLEFVGHSAEFGQ